MRESKDEFAACPANDKFRAKLMEKYKNSGLQEVCFDRYHITDTTDQWCP